MVSDTVHFCQRTQRTLGCQIRHSLASKPHGHADWVSSQRASFKTALRGSFPLLSVQESRPLSAGGTRGAQ